MKTDEPFPCTRIRSEEYEELSGHEFLPVRRNLLVLNALTEDKISHSRAAEILDMDLTSFREYFNSFMNAKSDVSLK